MSCQPLENALYWFKHDHIDALRRDAVHARRNGMAPARCGRKRFIRSDALFGYTIGHPEVPGHLRGTYAGLACTPIIDYLKFLGITAEELMPVHQFVADKHLVDRGLTNYWGYNSMLCFRGIDNAAYYRLVHGDRRYYMDYTGTGNTLDMTHPRVLQIIMDSLRYWVLEMRVDGFRFDLASALAREE